MEEQQKNFELSKKNSEAECRIVELNQELTFTKKKLENQKQENEKLKHAVKDLNNTNKNIQKELNFSSKKVGKLREENEYMSQQLVYGSNTLKSDQLKKSTLRSNEVQDFIDKR